MSSPDAYQLRAAFQLLHVNTGLQKPAFQCGCFVARPAAPTDVLTFDRVFRIRKHEVFLDTPATREVTGAAGGEAGY